MNIEEFARKVLEYAPRIMRTLAHQEHNDLTRGVITLPQFWALDYVCRHGPAKMSQLARTLGVSPATTTGLIERLIAQKLLERSNDEQDRRVVWVRIAPKGRAVIRTIREQKIKTLMTIFGKISSEDRERYLAILEQVSAIVDSLPATTRRSA